MEDHYVSREDKDILHQHKENNSLFHCQNVHWQCTFNTKNVMNMIF